MKNPPTLAWRALIVFGLIFLFFSPSFPQTVRETLTNAKIIELLKSGLSESIVVTKIRQSNCKCDTRTAALKKLQAAGASDAIILTIIESVGASPATSQGPSTEMLVQSAPAKSIGSRENEKEQVENNKGTLPKPDDQNQQLKPKRPGIPRVGIVTTVTTAPPEQDEAVRAQFYEVLYGNRETSSTEAILMREKLDRNIASEARLTRTDYLLYISLESKIQSAKKNRGNFIEKTVKAGAEALGAANKMVNPLAMLTGITYRSHQMADSLGASTTLLETITNATKKNDRIAINFKLIKVSNNEVVISQALKEVVATEKKEPILQNLLIQLGNEVVNTIAVRP